MRKKTARGARESSLASGWTIEADEAPHLDGAPEAPGPEAHAEEAPGQEAHAEAGFSSDAAADAAADAVSAAPERAQLSNGTLVILGVLGGLYLLYAWIWLSWASYYAGANAELAAASGAIGGTLQQLVFWAAPLAPILWFLAAMALNRGRTKRLVLWVAIGAIVLLPLPVFSGGGSV